MLVGVSGTVKSGRTEVLRYLEMQGFKVLSGSADQVVEYATLHYDKDHAVLIENPEMLDAVLQRPFFLHIAVDAPLRTRHMRQTEQSLEEFVDSSDIQAFAFARKAAESSHIRLINDFTDCKQLYIHLSHLNIRDESRIRPTWDAYFMQLANLAARRSNCMKRRVGCVVVRNSRVIATGYNGTAKGLPNCNEGGCPRCNAASGGGVALATCVCLHAEENALLEVGAERVSGATVYCNTCPCLTCTIKLIQCGVKEVVYSKSYYMDEEGARLFREAGVKLRQYTLPLTA